VVSAKDVQILVFSLLAAAVTCCLSKILFRVWVRLPVVRFIMILLNFSIGLFNEVV